MAVSSALNHTWTKRTFSGVTDGAGLLAEIETDLTNRGWTESPANTWTSPADKDGRKIVIVLASSAQLLQFTVDDHLGVTLITQRSIQADAGGSSGVIYSLADGTCNGICMQITGGASGIGDTFITFNSDTTGDPSTSSGTIYANATRNSSGTDDGLMDPILELYSNEGGSAAIQNRGCSDSYLINGGAIATYEYIDGTERSRPIRMMAAGSVTTEVPWNGYLPGGYFVSDAVADGTSKPIRIDDGVNGTFEVIDHTNWQAAGNCKVSLRTA